MPNHEAEIQKIDQEILKHRQSCTSLAKHNPMSGRDNRRYWNHYRGIETLELRKLALINSAESGARGGSGSMIGDHTRRISSGKT